MEAFEKTLRSIEERNHDDEFWIVSREVGEWLRDLVVSTQSSRVLEVGTSLGYSALWLADGVKQVAGVSALDALVGLNGDDGGNFGDGSDSAGVVCTIESHKGRRDEALANFASAGSEYEDVIVSLSDHAPMCFTLRPEIIPFAFDDIDLVFLDCIKMYYIELFDFLKDKLHVGAYFVADNIFSHSEAVHDFVSAVRADERFEVEVKDIGTGVLVAKKIA